MSDVLYLDVIDTIQTQPNIGVIVGFYDQQTVSGIQAYAVDARDGETMAAHFCSSESWAKSDLGFTIQGIPLGGSDQFNIQTNRVYAHKYPDGYITFWLGSAYANNFNMEMRNKQYEFKWKRSLEMLIHEVLNYDDKDGRNIIEALTEKYRIEGKDAMNETYEYKMKDAIAAGK